MGMIYRNDSTAPNLPGIPNASTPANGDVSTRIATTEFVNGAVSSLGSSAVPPLTGTATAVNQTTGYVTVNLSTGSTVSAKCSMQSYPYIGSSVIVEFLADGTPVVTGALILPFGPSAGSNLVAWFDASVASSITSGSSFVTRWADLSGAGNHATQYLATLGLSSSAVPGPIIGAGSIAGKNVLRFGVGGSRTALALPYSFSLTNQFTMMAVARMQATGYTGNQSVIIDGADDASAVVQVGPAVLGLWDGPPFLYNTSGPAYNTPFQITAIFSGPSSSAGTIRVNGSAVVSGVTGGATPAQILIGGYGNAMTGTQLSVVDIGELAIWSRILTTTEIAQAEAYFLSKWGV